MRHALAAASAPMSPAAFLFVFCAICGAARAGPSDAWSAPAAAPPLVNVALDKPVLESFSGSADSATSSASEPAVGWFSTAFAAFPDHTLYPETMTADTAAALREGVSTGDVRAVQRAVDNRAAAVQEIVTSQCCVSEQ